VVIGPPDPPLRCGRRTYELMNGALTAAELALLREGVPQLAGAAS
jgi:hypothetical protein